MSKQIAMIEAPVYEIAGADVPRVLHEFAAFEIFGGSCRVRTNPEGGVLFLTLGQRDFAVSLFDLAATAALAIEGHVKGEIRARIIGRREAPPPQQAPSPAIQPVPLRGEVEADGFITLYPRGR